MHTSPEMSPSSVHRHLKALRSKGFVELQVDERDNRIKFISYTPLSEQYFSRLGQCLDVKDGA
jgi:DNA-binding MarR family transcriptional regulator